MLTMVTMMMLMMIFFSKFVIPTAQNSTSQHEQYSYEWLTKPVFMSLLTNHNKMQKWDDSRRTAGAALLFFPDNGAVLHVLTSFSSSNNIMCSPIQVL